MVLITQSGPETLPIGESAPAFSLPATDGRTYSLESFASAKVLVLNFTCNHCPFAQAYEDRFVELAREWAPRGVAFAAINANDEVEYPDDSFEKMKERARQKNFPFPYLHDQSQKVAHAYGAVCTPHFFAFDSNRKLAYEGRFDDSYKDAVKAKSRDLREAIEALLAGKAVPKPNTNPMGCSIKWKSS